MKILPVSSGKGGVGKTTVALNLALALSKHHQTVLLDLDTGPSSLRHCLEMPFQRDLYHFLKDKCQLRECQTPLAPSIDPEGAFKNFFMIVSPKDFIHDFVNFTPEIKQKLVQGINAIQADFLVIDMKAGMDHQVIDFLPRTNSGIILFTPKVKAATLTAAEMAKAILLRTIRLLFGPSAPQEKYFDQKKTNQAPLLRQMMDLLEDTYSGEIRNIDTLLHESEQVLGKDHFLTMLKHHLSHYKVYFVLNQFNSIDESADSVIAPFIKSLYASVTASIAVRNLGWVMDHKEIRESTEIGIPFLVWQYYKKHQVPQADDSVDSRLRDILGMTQRPSDLSKKHAAELEISNQVDLLKKMLSDSSGKDPVNNFEFIAERVKTVAQSSVHDLGLYRMSSDIEFVNEFYSRLIP